MIFIGIHGRWLDRAFKTEDEAFDFIEQQPETSLEGIQMVNVEKKEDLKLYEPRMAKLRQRHWTFSPTTFLRAE